MARCVGDRNESVRIIHRSDIGTIWAGGEREGDLCIGKRVLWRRK